MKELSSEYIVKLHCSHETNEYLYIVLEFCNGGDLKRDMGKQTDKVYTLHNAARILSDVIRGLEVVHAKGFLHRDIKIDNILVNTD
jgi:serine/threonine protein kinase